MSYYAFIGSVPVTSATITTPARGAWYADVMLADAADLTGRQTLTVGDLVLSGTVYRAANFAGGRSMRIVGGANGWRTEVQPRAYESTAGVLASIVLGDLAAEVGETIELDDFAIGPFFVREAAQAGRILRQVVGREWYVDEDGVTHVGTRQSSAILSDFQIIEYSGGRGRLTIATERLSDWMPGRTFTGLNSPVAKTISSSTITTTNDGRARVEVLVDADDRQLDDFDALARNAAPHLSFLAVYEYAIQQVAGTLITASPTDTTLGLPLIARIPLRLPFMSGVLDVGDRVLVAFINGQPWRPVIIGADPGSTQIDIGNEALAPGARTGDAVTISVAQFAAAGPTNSGGPVTISAPMQATITGGSGQVRLG